MIATFGDNRIPESFWARVIPEPNTNCWLWLGQATNPTTPGYEPRGVVRHGDRRNECAHRFAWRMLRGELPRTSNLITTCGIGICCNPDHRYLPVVNEQSKQQRANMRRWIRKPENRRVLRSRTLMHKYGITIEQLEGLLAAQGEKCAICKSTIVLGATDNAKVCVDHCHESGDVRGLLCHPCNAGLGYFRDDQERLSAAAAYVFRHRTEGPIVPKTTERQFRCTKCSNQGHNSRTCHRRANESTALRERDD